MKILRFFNWNDLVMNPAIPKKSPKPGNLRQAIRATLMPKNGPKNKKAHSNVCYRFFGTKRSVLSSLEHRK